MSKVDKHPEYQDTVDSFELVEGEEEYFTPNESDEKDAEMPNQSKEAEDEQDKFYDVTQSPKVRCPFKYISWQYTDLG